MMLALGLGHFKPLNTLLQRSQHMINLAPDMVHRISSSHREETRSFFGQLGSR
jgi:hypothetical protein